MKLVYSIICSVVLSSSLLSMDQNYDTPRVILHEPLAAHKVWEMAIPKGANLYGATMPGKKKSITQDTIKIAIDSEGNIRINDANSYVTTVIVVPNDGELGFEGLSYTGVAILTTCYDGFSIILYDKKSFDNPQRLCAEIDTPTKIQKLLESVNKAKHTEERPSQTLTGEAVCAEKATSYNVRVLLDEQAPLHDSWFFASDNGFIISDPQDPKHSIKVPSKQLQVSTRNGFFYLNNKKFIRSQMIIKPQNGYLTFNDNDYQGSFLLLNDKGKSLLINNLNLEDYIVSVLKSEAWPGWPIEVNKVCAIASRTYAIGMVKRAHANKLPYHIKNTNVHQVYQGVHTSEELKKAVKETRGVFLSYEGQPILAMFDSCCGGVIPAHIKGFNFGKAPYLARTYACTYCKPYKVYTWQTRYTASDLVTALKREIPSLKKIKHIKVAKKDRAGLVEKVAVHSNKGIITLTGKKIYSLLSHVKSFCFSITKEDDSFVFKGKGYGHHIGLCQWGARGMVSKGFGYKEILKFYYPNTTFMRLS